MGNELFPDTDAYARFPEFPDSYPIGSYKPLHKAFAKAANVKVGQRTFFVDLSIGECECPKGFAFSYTDKNPKKPWYNNAYCTHKLRLMCSIVDAENEPTKRAELARNYLLALGTRYNVWEVVSAFHKELRRGKFDEAWFWALILSTKRGLRGVVQYMLNIIYEETRDHELALELIRTRSNPDTITLSSVGRLVLWFCTTPKKWEMRHRYAIFHDEMYGYKRLVADYGKDVARGGNIISANQCDKLVRALKLGAHRQDWVVFQKGLKGLQKLRYTNEERDDKALAEHRYWLYEQLYDLAANMCPDTHDVWNVIIAVNARIEADLGIGYHELNAIADAISDEPYGSGLLTSTKRQAVKKRPLPGIPLGVWPAIPLYAHDNHTFGGKRLMQRFAAQLKPGAQQTDLDFRWCGAYFGVAWRMLAYNQHEKCDIPWADVEWPSDIYNIVMSLWY
jgi:hypothetical protein